MNIFTGINLTKNVFAVHGVNENSKADLVKPEISRDLLPGIKNRVKRGQVLPLG